MARHAACAVATNGHIVIADLLGSPDVRLKPLRYVQSYEVDIDTCTEPTFRVGHRWGRARSSAGSYRVLSVKPHECRTSRGVI